MSRRPVDWARRNAEQEVQTSARALHALHALRFPEARARAIAAHGQYAEAVEPAARAMWTPANVRAIAGWLNTLADEINQADDARILGRRDLGTVDCARIIAALESYAEDTLDQEDSATYRQLADDIAGCDRLILVPQQRVEEELG